MLAPAAGAEAGLRERAEVGLVVDLHGHAQAGTEDLGHGRAVPAAQEPERGHGAGGDVHRSGDADADGEHLVERRVDGLDHLAEHEGGAVEPRVGPVVGCERHPLLGDDAVRDVGQRDA